MRETDALPKRERIICMYGLSYVPHTRAPHDQTRVLWGEGMLLHGLLQAVNINPSEYDILFHFGTLQIFPVNRCQLQAASCERNKACRGVRGWTRMGADFQCSSTANDLHSARSASMGEMRAARRAGM